MTRMSFSTLLLRVTAGAVFVLIAVMEPSKQDQT